jgi:hypothetical protein
MKHTYRRYDEMEASAICDDRRLTPAQAKKKLDDMYRSPWLPNGVGITADGIARVRAALDRARQRVTQ